MPGLFVDNGKAAHGQAAMSRYPRQGADRRLFMLVFGKYEAIKELSRPASGPVYEGCPLGNKADATYLIKTFNPTGEEKDPAQLQLDPRVGAFLERVGVQKRAAEGSNRIAPIHESGIAVMGAFYVSTLYPSSVSRLIRGKVRLDAVDLHAVISAVVEGLLQIRNACKQAHGDLGPESILLGRRGKTGYSEIVLAEPQTPQLANKTGEAGDVRAVANIVHQLVAFRTLKEAGGFPAQYGPEWSRLKKGKQWLELVNWVLDPARPAAELTLDALAQRVTKLKVGKDFLKPLLATAAILILAAGIGIPTMVWHRNKVDREKWAGEWKQYIQVYQTWFASIYGDVKANELDESDEWVEQAIVSQIRGHEGDFDLNNLAGSSEPNADSPPADPDVRRRTENALKVATRISDAVVGQKKGWKSLEKVQELRALFQEEGWNGPSKVLDDAIKQLVPGKSLGKGINAVVAVKRKAAPIEAGANQLKAEIDRLVQTQDPVLASFKAYCAQQINSAIEQKLKESSSDDPTEVVFKALQEKLTVLSGMGKKAYDFAGSGELAGVDLLTMKQSSSLYKEPLTEKLWDKWVEETAKFPSRPDVRKNWDSSLAVVEKGIDEMRAAAQEADQGDFAELARLQVDYAALDTSIKELRARPWRKETFDPIEADKTKLTQQREALIAHVPQVKADLDKEIAAWRERMRLGFEKTLADRAARTFKVASPALEKLAEDLRSAEVNKTRADAAALGGAPKDLRAKNKLLSQLDEQLKVIGALAASLNQEMQIQLPLPSEQPWEVNVAKAIEPLAAARKEELIKSAVATASIQPNVKSPEGLGSDFLTNWKSAKDKYTDYWKSANSFILAHARIVQMLGRSYGLEDAVGENGEKADELLKKWPEFSNDRAVSEALGPVLEQVSDLRKVAAFDQPSAIKLLASTARPDLMWAAWRHLRDARDISWPRGPADMPQGLKAYKAIEKLSESLGATDLKRSTFLKEKLGQDGRQIVASLLVAGGSDQEIEAAIKAALDNKGTLGVGDNGVLSAAEADALKLGGRERFNCFLYQEKQKALSLDGKIKNPEGRATAARIEKDLLAYVPDKLPIEQELSDGLDGLVKDTDDSLASAKPLAGPETVSGFQIDMKKEGKSKIFTIGDQTLRFILVDDAKDAEGKRVDPYYLSATEVSVGLVETVMERSGKTLKDFDLTLPTNPPGPVGWRVVGNTIAPSAEWLAGNPVHESGQPPMPGKNASPSADMPITQIGPDTAMYFAEALRCRLPTYGEWWAASRRQQHVPNLRDATWQKEFALTVADAKDSTRRRWPYEARFLPPFRPSTDSEKSANVWAAADLQKLGVPVPANYDDQSVFFAPVDATNMGFSHLIGNVAEMCWDDRKKWEKGPRGVIEDFQRMYIVKPQPLTFSPDLCVAGGSAISPPELGLDRLPWRKPPEPAKGWADVGFRLAFDAVKPPIIVRLKDLLRDQKYAMK